ncbi:MAG: aminotransferase class V-fold PLP-dependent enzyme [Saprospiraceae bacterium]|nr:aminotransferase class V-fold PLP-dependent enzyme [Saprospiraceae bacterium]
MKFETTAIRLQTERSQHREHSTPIFPTSSFVFNDAEQMRSLFADEQEGNIYSRFTNPNCSELEQKMAAMEGVDDAVCTSSGMAAIFASIMGLLRAGDHMLATKAIFGATFTVFTQWLPRWGITCDWLETDTANWQASVRPNTKMLFIETPSNPGLDIIDLEAAGRFAKHNNLIFNVDNCFATPYLQQPAAFGADLITHSSTKFLDGQGRVLGGLVAGRADLLAEIKKFCRSTGPSLSPFNAWLLSKSLETLAVRLDRHCDNALALAKYLSSHDEVQQVRYPFLESHPAHAVARKQMKNGGGLVTFEVKGGLEQGRRFLDALQMLSLSANLGDTRSIATHPASTTHAKMTAEARKDAGISDGLIRISAGLEHIDDIIADIDNALKISKV